MGWLLTTFIHILAWLDATPLNTLVDLRLDHWHLSRHEHSFFSSLRALMRALAWQGSIGQSSDNAAFEVQPNATRRINDATTLYDCTTYLSFSSAPRAPLHALGTSIVRERSILSLLCTAVREVLVLVFSACVRLGGARKRRAAIEHLGYDAKEWAAHDGLLSVHGQRCPIGETSSPLPPHLTGRPSSRDDDEVMPPLTPSTRDVIVTRERASCSEASRSGSLRAGMWHVHALEMDHFAVCGGPLASSLCIDDFWDMYVRVRAEL